jgi:predicted ATPase/class 3 adenylate cyclase
MSLALPTGTVTFLFTDIEGSTHLLQRLGETYARVLAESQRILRQAIAQHGGSEVDTQGDSFFVAFPTAPAAVAAAVAATRSLAEHPWPEGAALRVRMGLHTGAPQLVGDRYVGLDVHRAARIAAAGYGSQILLSVATRALVAHDLPEGTTLRDLGAYRLKDLQQPEPITQLVLAELPSDFPPLKTLDRRTHNLPIQPTPLLGREEQVAALAALLRRADVRLVTVTGAGGIGKTRLALQTAAEVLEDFPDGAWLVRLSRLNDPDLVLPTILQTLGLKEGAGQPIAQTLREHLRELHLLLVLDNFEQVVAAAPAVNDLLAQCPGLRVLVTSRIPLRLRAEHEYPVVPLSLPDPRHLPPPERLTQYAAVALFVERAAAAQPDFMVTAANAPAIAEICARLDGLPLAIELAAARVKLLTPEVLLARLARQLQLLTGGARDLEARQQTMRATIAWSVALLAPEEQALFWRLGVFVGGGTLEAVEVVCLAREGTEGVAPLGIDLLDGLGALVDQSLVQRREEGGELRFGMLHVIREYALEQVDERHDLVEALRRAHTNYYLALTEQMRPLLDGGPNQADLLNRLEREHDNLRAAMDWSLEHGAAETAARLWVAIQPFLTVSGHWIEQGQWLTQLLTLSHALPSHPRARLLSRAGYTMRLQGNFSAAIRLVEESLALLRGWGDTVGVAEALGELAALSLGQGQFEQAEELWEESLHLSQQVGDHKGVLDVLKNQTNLPYVRGDYQAAWRLDKEALALAESLGDAHDIAICKTSLGELALLEGHDDEAEALLQDALAVQEQLHDSNCSAMSLRILGILALERADVAIAQARLEQSLALFAKIAKQVSIPWTQICLGLTQFATDNIQNAEAAYLTSLRIAQRLERGLWARLSVAAGLEAMAEIAIARRHPERAARLLGAAAQTLASLAAVPPPLPPRLRAEREQAIARARLALGDAAWTAAFAAGEALSLDEALTEALTPGS